MGGKCNCISDACNKNEVLFTNNEIYPLTNRESMEKLKSINYSSLEDAQYENLSKEIFNILSDIRMNPENYELVSKDYSLYNILIKTKPGTKLLFSENNIDYKKYIIDSYFQKKSIQEQEKGLKSLINKGNIQDIFLFQFILKNKDMKDSIWTFLHENEDDLDKVVFSDRFDYLIVICLPLDQNEKILCNLIFYKQ
jgi:hypothetical protein